MSRPSLRSMMRQPRRQGQHRRIRSLERRAGESDTDRAGIRKELREIRACLLVAGLPIEDEIPSELTCAVISGCRGPVTLDVGGQTVVAGLDPDRPGDVVEIWRAIKTVASKQAS
jgi:hypothetical protein